MKRLLLASTAIAAIALAGCQTPGPFAARADRLAATADAARLVDGFAPRGYQRLGAPDFGIVYVERQREIHIYGRDDAENLATVELVQSGVLAVSPIVRVTLTSGSAVTGDMEVFETPLFEFVLNTPPAPTDPQGDLASDGPFPAAPPPRVLVREVWFHGGDEVDDFDNRTDIPSKANGRDGADTLRGGGGQDELLGGQGADLLIGRGGPDTLDGDFGSDRMFGGSGDDELTASANGNDNDSNLYCGGSGADTLEAASFSINMLDGELADGADDGFADRLEGKNNGAETSYEFNAPPDVIIEDGNLVTPEDGFAFPFSSNIEC